MFSTRNGLATDDVRTLVESSTGDLWVGGYGGLSVGQLGRFQHWTERDGLPSNNIRSIYQDSQGVLWIGTYDGGLARLKSGHLTHYGQSDGLFNNGVFQILEDADEDLWMSSNRGIYRVSKRELNEFADGQRKTINSIAYGKSDGMLNVECNGGFWPAGVKTRDGKLWFPTQNGVAVIDPKSVPVNGKEPPVIIESSVLDNVSLPVSDTIRVLPGKQSLELHYTALSFIKPDHIQFKYRMEGLDAGWVNAGNRRTAYYSHMPPGNYRFQVTARNSDGVWNDLGQSVPVVVLAPFYRKWWFVASLCCLCVGLLAAIANYRVQQARRAQIEQQRFSQQLISSQEGERKRIAAELHDSLGQRLIVINNLALFFLRARGPDAENTEQFDAIEEISTEAALAIEETRSISYNLRPFQLDRLGLTKSIEGLIRSVSKASSLQVTSELVNVDEVFPEELRINFYRIVQEALSNIMKHAAATEVNVQVQRGIARVTLSIRDNGRGSEQFSRAPNAGPGGFGLTGIAERASLLGGTLRMRSEPGKGTVVLVEIPVPVEG